MRDSQRSKVYACDHALVDSPYSKTLTFQEAAAFIEKMNNSAYMMRKHHHGKQMRVTVLRGRNAGHAGDSWTIGRFIKLGVYGRCHAMAIHELAHHYAGLGHQHDWRFAEVYLDMVRHFLGAEAAKFLREQYRRNRVKYTQPKPKRQLTDEQREVLRERMAALREAKAAKAVGAV
jgi:hypothetical protein